MGRPKQLIIILSKSAVCSIQIAGAAIFGYRENITYIYSRMSYIYCSAAEMPRSTHCFLQMGLCFTKRLFGTDPNECPVMIVFIMYYLFSENEICDAKKKMTIPTYHIAIAISAKNSNMI